MVNMQAPKGVTQVSVESQTFEVDDKGTVRVPETFVETLKDVGFRFVPSRIVVTQEAHDAIKAAAKKLNLPMPEAIHVPNPENLLIPKALQVQHLDPSAVQFSKFMQETSGGFHATDQDWTTVGMDGEGWPVAKGSKEDVSAQPNPPDRKAGSKEDAERRAKMAEERGTEQSS